MKYKTYFLNITYYFRMGKKYFQLTFSIKSARIKNPDIIAMLYSFVKHNNRPLWSQQVRELQMAESVTIREHDLNTT